MKRIPALAALVLGALLTVPMQAQNSPAVADGTVGPRSESAPAPPKKTRPDTYGITGISYYVIDASELSPITSGNQYSGINNFQLRYLTNVSGLGFWAPVHLPAGASVQSMEIDYFDNSAVGEVQASFGVCDFEGMSCAFQAGNCIDNPITICSGNTNAPGYGNTQADMSGDGITIDNFFKGYKTFVGNTTNDGSTAISQIIIGYKLQVSPAPGTATFTDVPTSDFAFQFIEAFNAAGITVGCDLVGPKFCPDRNVTRREMAVFFAKALGLQFQ
jgi:hypothetical protein